MANYNQHDGLYCGTSSYYTPPKQIHHTPAINEIRPEPCITYYNSNHNQTDPELKHVGYSNDTHPKTKSRQRRSCCDILCCGCCICCPRWIRYCSCVILLIIIAVLATIGGLASTFRKPTIDFGGIQGTPDFSLTGTTGSMQFNMNIIINNPNIVSVTFRNIEAKAYYPNVGGMDLSKTPIGGGNKTNVRIGAQSITTLLFPFTIHFDAFSKSTAPIVNDLLQKCGINNQAKQDIVINYSVTPLIQLFDFPITFTIYSHSSFACPEGATDGINNVLGPLTSMANSSQSGFPTDLAGVKSMIESSLPTDLLNSLPSGLLNGL